MRRAVKLIGNVFLIPPWKLKKPRLTVGNCYLDSDENKIFSRETAPLQQTSLANFWGESSNKIYMAFSKRVLRKAYS